MRFPPFNPYIAVFIGIIAISASPIFVKLVLDTPASVIANYRLLIASIVMLPLIFTKHKNEIKRISKQEWVLTIIAGLFLALHFILWFGSLSYTSVTSSVILISMQPIFVFIFAYIFFKERLSHAAIISVFISLFGMVIIIWSDYQVNITNFFGDMLALLGTASISLFYLFGQKVRKRLSILTYTFIVYAVGAVALLLYNIVMNYSLLGYPGSYWWIFISLSIFPTFFGHVLFNWSLKWLSVSTIEVGNALVPLGATVFAYLIFNELVSPSEWLGGAVAIFGLFLFIVSTSRKRRVTISQNRWD